jgi:hypothetical protein
MPMRKSQNGTPLRLRGAAAVGSLASGAATATGSVASDGAGSVAPGAADATSFASGSSGVVDVVGVSEPVGGCPEAASAGSEVDAGGVKAGDG